MCGVTNKEEKFMKIYIVMGDHSEYHEGVFYPQAAFTKKELAKRFIEVDTYYWGIDDIEEVDIEATGMLWVVTSEEAYGSGESIFRKAFATKEEAEAYAKGINDDVDHVRTTLFNAKVDDVGIDSELEWLEEEYYKRIESRYYKNKFKVGDKVRLMTLDEIRNTEGVVCKRDERGEEMFLNRNYHAKVWIHFGEWLLSYLGKYFVIEKILGDCVEVPHNICYLQDWLFVKDE